MQTPNELSEIRMRLSAEYARATEEYANVLDECAIWWKETGFPLAETESMAHAERMWKVTEGGLKEAKLKLRMRALEKEQNAIASHLRVLDTEARNMT